MEKEFKEPILKYSSSANKKEPQRHKEHKEMIKNLCALCVFVVKILISKKVSALNYRGELIVRLFINLFLIFSILLPQPLFAQKQEQKQEESKKADPMSATTFAGLKLRSVGPALSSG